MTAEVVKTIVSVLVLIGVFIVFIYVYFYFKELNRYINDINTHLYNGTKDIYSHIAIYNKKYLPYYHTHGYACLHKFGSVNTRCELTGFSAKKNYLISPEKILYIVNDKMKYDFNIVEIDGKKYIELNDEIKTMQVLFSFGIPAHLLYKLEFSKVGEDEYSLKIIEEVLPGGQGTNPVSGTGFKL